MAKVTKSSRNSGERDTIVVKTRDNSLKAGPAAWWKGKSEEDRALGLISTATFLKEQQAYRFRQASLHARLYGNMPLTGFYGSNSMGKLSNSSQLPMDRPTMNVIQSCVDTLVSRITQSRPRPVFLTDGGNYRTQRLAEQLNNFMDGELHATKAHQMGELILRDAAVIGTGVIKAYRDQEDKVALERTLATELLVDPNDSLFGAPRQLYQLKLVDRSVVAEMFANKKSRVDNAEQAYPDSGGESSKTVSDQIMLVEGWHLKSGPDATDGKHIIACSDGMLFEEDYDKDRFPFVFLPYSPRLVGFFGQPLTEQLMGTQIEINKMLMTAARSINLSGVPRVWLEDGSKVVKAHITNEIGMIGTYRGKPPIFEPGNTGLAPDFYAQLQRLVEYAYQQSGISSLAATSQKPAGLDSGQAIREYDDLQSDRFAALNKRYDNMYIDLAYLIVDLAKDIAEDTGSYASVYPSKAGTQEVDLPKMDIIEDSFVIQCFDSSALPKDPAGRKQEVVERMQAGLLTPDQARKLLDLPDLQAEEKLLNAGEDRIKKILDEIVEDGQYSPPDPFMDLDKAHTLAIQFYNLYTQSELEEDKAEMLRTFATQALALKQEAMAAMAPPPGASPEGLNASGGAQAVPQAPPISPLLPNAPKAV
jgi:hypothetical protein